MCENLAESQRSHSRESADCLRSQMTQDKLWEANNGKALESALQVKARTEAEFARQRHQFEAASRSQ